MIKRSIKTPMKLLIKSYIGNVNIPGELSNWILANSFWNDSGSWLDDATWND